jgi:hypothetical protein
MAKTTVTSSTSKSSNTSASSGSNSFGSPNLGVPSFNPATLNSSSEMGRANFFGEQAGFGQLSQAQSAAALGSGIAAQAYQNKANTDFNQAARMNSLNRGNQTFTASTMTGTPISQLDIIRAQNAGRLTETMVQATNQRGLSEQEYLQNQDITRRQLATQRDITALQGSAQRDIARTQAEAQVASAGLGAFGNVLGSLFGSVNSGNPNYKYW